MIYQMISDKRFYEYSARPLIVLGFFSCLEYFPIVAQVLFTVVGDLSNYPKYGLIIKILKVEEFA